MSLPDKFKEIRAVQCQNCGEIFEDIDQAEECQFEGCPHPLAIEERQKLLELSRKPTKDQP